MSRRTELNSAPRNPQIRNVQIRDLAVLESEVSKRGWRTEGVGARKSFICQRFKPFFLYPFSYAPLGEGAHISGELFGLFLGFVCRQTPPANPFPLRSRSAPESVRESVSKNRGVPESVWGSALGAFLKVT